MISKEALDLIISHEVSSPEVYKERYTGPIWPGAQSGITVGIGYDLGYHTATEIRMDWGGLLPDEMLDHMCSVAQKTGSSAKNKLHEVRNVIFIPYETAAAVFAKDMTKWEIIVSAHVPNTENLSPTSRGALVSLAYNRGPSFNRDGDRYKEMRNIKTHMTNKEFHKIPDEIRAMKRIWKGKGLPGLLRRRDDEAALFEKGLVPVVPAVQPVEPTKALPVLAVVGAGTIIANDPTNYTMYIIAAGAIAVGVGVWLFTRK